jgi:YtkA-like protein
MRVRPFFWLLLAASCIGVLIFAATIQEDVPAVMQVRVEQHSPAPAEFTTVELHLADSEGLPIEEARIFSSANMTDMNMVVHQRSVKYLGHGNYAAQLQLYMAGRWEIDIRAEAVGFEALHRTLLVLVQ